VLAGGRSRGGHMRVDLGVLRFGGAAGRKKGERQQAKLHRYSPLA
jgi:hypothetical protein